MIISTYIRLEVIIFVSNEFPDLISSHHGDATRWACLWHVRAVTQPNNNVITVCDDTYAIVPHIFSTCRMYM